MKLLMYVPSVNYETFDTHSPKALEEAQIYSIDTEAQCLAAYGQVLRDFVNTHFASYEEGEEIDDFLGEFLTLPSKPKKPNLPYDASPEELTQATGKHEQAKAAYEDQTAAFENFRMLFKGQQHGFTVEELQQTLDILATKWEVVKPYYEKELS